MSNNCSNIINQLRTTVCELKNNASNSLTSTINVPVTFNSISVDTVMNVLNGMKTAFDNNYYLLSLITKYKNEIKLAGRYDTILKPIVEKGFIGNEDYFWVINTPKNESQFSNATHYFTWNQYKNLDNKKFVEITNINYMKNLFEYVRNQYSFASSFDSSVEKYNKLYLNVWDEGIDLNYNTYILDILDDTKQTWIEIGSAIGLMPYFQISKKESEEYVRLLYITDDGRKKLYTFCQNFGLTDKEIELLWDQSLNEKKGAELGFSTQTDYFNYLVKKAREK